MIMVMTIYTHAISAHLSRRDPKVVDAIFEPPGVQNTQYKYS